MSDSTCLDTNETEWMLSDGQTPCQIAQSIVRACSATARVQHLSVDFSCSSLGIQNSSPCCCTTVTYAVVSACWVCQTSQDPTQISTTYRSWLAGCPVPLNGLLPPVVSSVNPPIPVPGWAVVPPGDVESRWDQSLAQRTVGYTPSSSTNTSTTATATATAPILTSSTSPPNQARPPPPYTPIAVGTALALVFMLGMSWWLYRRRNRVAPSVPAADFEIDPSDTLLGGHEHHDDDGPKSWGWWTRRLKGGDQKRTSASDPGKIDAWRYPFDYTPVSVDGSRSGSGSGRQGYYDPYNPTRSRRRSESRSDNIPLRGRVSADTLHVPGQLSHHHSSSSLPGAAPGYTPPSPTPGYSPSPRYSTPQPLPQAMYTPSNQYPAAHLQQPALVSPAGYRTPQGIVTPFPYTQPPSHGTTPLSPSHGPMSPQTYTSPQTPHTTSPRTPRTHRAQHTFELSLSPTQYAEIRNMYPEVRVRKKKRRRRERREAGGSDAEQAAGPSAGEPRGRPRSWSTPTGARPQPEPEPEEEWDGRPRNGVELREKYSRRRESDANAGVNARTRARDGGISLMGGPPPKR